jgi:hypothetical protein
MLRMLEVGLKAYQLDYGKYPPGNGTGSRSLMNALRSRGSRGLPYVELVPEDLDREGNVRNPLDPDKIISYRNPGVRNPKMFDLWCEDAEGHPEGINNWGR